MAIGRPTGTVLKRIYLALGSNLGDREANLLRAVNLLDRNQVLVSRLSPIYETEPEGILDQPWFLNAVAEARTALLPAELLVRIKAIEKDMKRVNTVRNGPRLIDIDILFYGSDAIATPELEIPHPRFRERRFVLVPLVDLAPDLRDPVTQRTAAELLAGAAPSRLRRL